MDTSIEDLIDDTPEIDATVAQKEECLRFLVHAKTVLYAAIQALQGDEHYGGMLTDDLGTLTFTERLIRNSIPTRERIAETAGRR